MPFRTKAKDVKGKLSKWFNYKIGWLQNMWDRCSKLKAVVDFYCISITGYMFLEFSETTHFS